MPKPVDLYKLFQTERERHKDKGVNICYNKARNSMQYSDESGTLTVLFKETEDVCEEFYWKSADNKEKGIGKLCYETYECPVTTATLVKGSIQATSDMDLLAEMPEKMVEITQDYQFERDSVGLEEKPVLKYAYEK